MPSLKKQIEDAVITILNAGSFSQEFTAVRGPRSLKKLEQTSTLQCIVAAVPVSRKRLSRGGIDWTFLIGVGFFKKVGFDDDEEINDSGLEGVQLVAEEAATALDVKLTGLGVSNSPLVPEIDYEPDDGTLMAKGIAAIQVNAQFMTFIDRN